MLHDHVTTCAVSTVHGFLSKLLLVEYIIAIFAGLTALAWACVGETRGKIRKANTRERQRESRGRGITRDSISYIRDRETNARPPLFR